ncbi:MAG: NAD-dependent epimerase/dehydratase family protein, partial [Actinobacteria bacterium]|nr:NAD-dependent epimerase/dehydratase family protein [Actinomycetota bacterium]
MRLLILGGTKFLGRAIVDAALAGGHEVTLFNRGTTNAELYPDVEKLRGDRTSDLSALEGRTWDAVVDVAGYVPAVVRASADALRDSGRYVFISSISVYANFDEPWDESGPVGELGDAPVDELAADYSNYGPLKALCEAEVEAVFGERALIVRPGLIVGPHDPTGRFTYWPQRLARGGEILAPGQPERLAQFIDVRDLADWTIAAVERDLGGVYNATDSGIPWGELLAGAAVTWVTDEFLTEQGVGEWMELPLWIAGTGLRVDVSRIVAAGLGTRPLAETLAGAAEAPAADGVGLTP